MNRSKPGESAAEEEGHGHLGDLAAGERLLRQIVDIRLAASGPEGLAIRRFLESSAFDKTIESLHALNLQSGIHESAKSVRHSVEAIKSMQTKVEYVEIFLIGVYSVYLIHYLGDNFGFKPYYIGWSILIGATGASFLALLLLRPWDHSASRKSIWTRIPANILLYPAVILVILTVYLLVGYIRFHQAN